MLSILKTINEDSEKVAKLRRFDKRTKVVKDLIKKGVNIADRKQDGRLYLIYDNKYYQIYFQGDKNLKIYCVLECNENCIPINRINLLKIDN